MRVSFEITGVGRAWRVLLGGHEAWFARGLSGYLLGPFSTSEDVAEALIAEHRSFKAGTHKREIYEPGTWIPEFEFAHAGRQIGALEEAPEWTIWAIFAGPQDRRGFYIVLGSSGVLAGLRTPDRDSALTAAQQANHVATGMDY